MGDHDFSATPITAGVDIGIGIGCWEGVKNAESALYGNPGRRPGSPINNFFQP